MQVIKALNGAEVNLLFSWHRFDTRSADLNIWGSCFSTYFKTQNIYLKKRAVEAAKSNCLSSRHVKIHYSKDLLIKMPQNWANCKSTKAIFMSKEVSLPKISLNLQKMKIRPKSLQLLLFLYQEKTN